MKTARLALAFALLLACGQAFAGSQPPPAVPLPPSLSDIGVATTNPDVTICGGQSNAQGVDTLGSKTVNQTGGGIWIVNDGLAGTALIPAAFGTAPINLGAGGSGTTTVPANAANNLCVQYANDLRASGTIAASRPIVIVPNWLGGRSISYWIGSGTNSAFWLNLLTNLSVVNSVYPGFTIRHVIWAQGENDSSLATTYGTQAAYGTAFATLLAQWRGLPQWTPLTTISVQELAAWWDNNSGMGRNDFIRTLRAGSYDPAITVVSSDGLVESVQAPGPHFDGNSDVVLGARHFAARQEARIGGQFISNGLATVQGGVDIRPSALSVTTGGTLNIGDQDLRAAGASIVASGGTINLPPGSLFTKNESTVLVSATTTVIANSVTNSTSLVCIESASACQTTVSLPSGRYRLWSMSSNWYLESMWPRVGNTSLYSKGFGSGTAQTINSGAAALATYDTAGNTITLPSPSNGGSMMFFNILGSSNTTLNGTVTNMAGAAVSTYTVLPGASVQLIGQNATWVVVSDTLDSRLAQLPHGVTAGRPTGLASTQRVEFFDDTLGLPIWWNGTAWKDATGTTR